MKKAVFVLLAMLGVLCPIFCGSVARAQGFSYDGEAMGNDINGKWDAFFSSLPDEIKGELDFSPSYSEKTLTSLLEKTNLSYWWGRIKDAFFVSIDESASFISSSLAMVLVVSALSLVYTRDGEMSETLSRASLIVFGVFIFTSTADVIARASAYALQLSGIMNMMVPLIETIFFLGGEFTQGNIAASALMLCVSLVGNLGGAMLIPMTETLFALSATARVCTDLSIASLCTSIRRFLERSWTVVCIFFSFILAAQSSIAQSVDSLLLRSSRFAIGTFIPVAGGMIAEAFGTLKSGLSFLKTAVGVSGVVVILLITLPGIIPLILYRFGLFASAECARILGQGALCSLIEEMCGIADFLIGIVLSVCLMFLFALILFTKIAIT